MNPNASITFELSENQYTTLRLDDQGKSSWMIVCPGGRAILSSAEAKVLAFSSYAEAMKLVNSLNDTAALQRVFKDKMPEPMSVPMQLPFLRKPDTLPLKQMEAIIAKLDAEDDTLKMQPLLKAKFRARVHPGYKASLRADLLNPLLTRKPPAKAPLKKAVK